MNKEVFGAAVVNGSILRKNKFLPVTLITGRKKISSCMDSNDKLFLDKPIVWMMSRPAISKPNIFIHRELLNYFSCNEYDLPS